GRAHARAAAAFGIGGLDEFGGAAEFAAGADRRARQRTEIADSLEALDALGPCHVGRIVALAQVLGDTVALAFVEPRADDDLAVGRGRARIVAIDDDRVDLVAALVLRGCGRGEQP